MRDTVGSGKERGVVLASANVMGFKEHICSLQHTVANGPLLGGGRQPMPCILVLHSVQGEAGRAVISELLSGCRKAKGTQRSWHLGQNTGKVQGEGLG